MSAIKMRLKKASFRPMKTMPTKATRLTTVTDARITIKSAMASNSHAESIVLFFYYLRLGSEKGGTMHMGLPSLRA
jgi:hypothetical protein